MLIRWTPERQAVWQSIAATFKTPHTLVVLLLGILLFGSALAVICVKNTYRQTFITLQEAKQQQTRMDVEWAQLLLEQTTWAAQTHVQDVAEQTLNMVVPKQRDIQQVEITAQFPLQ